MYVIMLVVHARSILGKNRNPFVCVSLSMRRNIVQSLDAHCYHTNIDLQFNAVLAIIPK